MGVLLMDDIKSVDIRRISHFFHGIRLVSYRIMFHGMSTGMGGHQAILRLLSKAILAFQKLTVHQ